MNSVEPAGTLVYTKLWSNLPQTSLQIGRVDHSTGTDFRHNLQIESFQKSSQFCSMGMPSKIIGTEGPHLQILLYFPIQTWQRKFCKMASKAEEISCHMWYLL